MTKSELTPLFKKRACLIRQPACHDCHRSTPELVERHSFKTHQSSRMYELGV